MNIIDTLDQSDLFAGNPELHREGVARLTGTDNDGIIGVHGRPRVKCMCVKRARVPASFSTLYALLTNVLLN